MINSMTGYGQSQGKVNEVVYAVEIKTVNNRYLKTNIRLPDVSAFLEDEIERLIHQNLSRGTVSYSLNMKNVAGNMPYEIDEDALRCYLEKLSVVGVSEDIPCRIDIGGLLSLPGVLIATTPDEEAVKSIRETVLHITQEALDQVNQMRAVEGQALYADLEEHCATIKSELEKIKGRSHLVLQEYQDKLKKRVDVLLSEAGLELDKETLAREVALFAERTDISEEVTRLESHIGQFCESSSLNSLAGRKLDFISQEMLREANTIASKASDTEIIMSVVEIKCYIDRIKEQVQNVE
ncbi:MAG: YicC/YloC family endoribonuclease [Planctomycetota bacterium]|jgi:uncharacterized protein (TIGR00255 family)